MLNETIKELTKQNAKVIRESSLHSFWFPGQVLFRQFILGYIEPNIRIELTIE